MPNAADKGRRNENEARTIYEKAGYDCQPFRGTRWDESDGYNAFDFVAVHPDRRTRWVQVKSNSTQGELGKVMDVARERMPWPEHALIDFVIKYDRKGWRLLQPTTDGHVVAVDERKDDRNIGELLEKELQP